MNQVLLAIRLLPEQKWISVLVNMLPHWPKVKYTYAAGRSKVNLYSALSFACSTRSLSPSSTRLFTPLPSTIQHHPSCVMPQFEWESLPFPVELSTQYHSSVEQAQTCDSRNTHKRAHVGPRPQSPDQGTVSIQVKQLILVVQKIMGKRDSCWKFGLLNKCIHCTERKYYLQYSSLCLLKSRLWTSFNHEFPEL